MCLFTPLVASWSNKKMCVFPQRDLSYVSSKDLLSLLALSQIYLCFVFLCLMFKIFCSIVSCCVTCKKVNKQTSYFRESFEKKKHVNLLANQLHVYFRKITPECLCKESIPLFSFPAHAAFYHADVSVYATTMLCICLFFLFFSVYTQSLSLSMS